MTQDKRISSISPLLAQASRTVIAAPDQMATPGLLAEHAYFQLAALAAREAIRYGVMGRLATVLDVYSRSPRVGLHKALRRVVAWGGQYIGVGPDIPPRDAQAWNTAHQRDPVKNRVQLQPMSLEFEPAQVLEAKGLPFPPNAAHPFKMIAAAFCVDALGKVRNRNNLIIDLKGVAAQITVAGGVDESDLIRWGFQTFGGLEIDGKDSAWGVWMDDRAFAKWKRRNRFPETVMGILDPRAGGRAVLPQRQGVCQTCGEPDLAPWVDGAGNKRYGGKSHFGCTKCGAENKVRDLRYRRNSV